MIAGRLQAKIRSNVLNRKFAALRLSFGRRAVDAEAFA